MDGAGCRVKEDNEFTLARLELFHMKPGGVHPWHLPAPNLGHGMLVSATVLSSTTKPIYALKDGLRCYHHLRSSLLEARSLFCSPTNVGTLVRRRESGEPGESNESGDSGGLARERKGARVREFIR